MASAIRSFKLPVELAQAIEEQAACYGRGFSEEVRLALQMSRLLHTLHWLGDPRLQELRPSPRHDREEIRNRLSALVHEAFTPPPRAIEPFEELTRP
jgi:hypothetical protein